DGACRRRSAASPRVGGPCVRRRDAGERRCRGVSGEGTTAPAARRELAAWWVLGVAGGLLVLALQQGAITPPPPPPPPPHPPAPRHAALQPGGNVAHPAPPPVVKLLAAVPLLGEGELLPLLDVTRWREASAAVFHDRALTLRAQRRSRTVLAFVFVVPWLLA